MAIQRSKILGDQYYSNEEREYVAPPIQERKNLALNKEQDYLLTKNAQNALVKFQKTLPHLERDKEVYEQLTGKIDNFNTRLKDTDNLEDFVLDTDQFAHDVMYKYYGNDLINRATRDAEQEKVLKEAKDSGEITPDMYNWYRQRRINQDKGFIKDEETGEYISTPVPSATYSPYFDIEKDQLEKLKDWEENKYITRNQDGTITVNESIPGYLDYGENEIISQEELMQSALSSVRNNPNAQAYLNDRAEMLVSQMDKTGETLNKSLTNKQKEFLFEDANISSEEIQDLINNNEIDPEYILKEIVKNKEVTDALTLPVNKYSYNRESLTTLENKLLLDSLDAQRVARTKKQEENTNSLADVSLNNFTTTQIASPVEIKRIDQDIKNLSEEYKSVTIAKRAYEKDLKEGKKGVDSSRLKEFEKTLQSIDERYEQSVRQKDNIKTAFNNLLLSNDINVEERYENSSEELVAKTKEKNYSLLTDPNNYLDITEVTEKREDGYYIEGNKIMDNFGKPVNTGALGRSSGIYVRGENGEILINGLSNRSGDIESLSSLFNENGEYIQGVKILKADSSGNKTTYTNSERQGYKYPTVDTYAKSLLDYASGLDGDYVVADSDQSIIDSRIKDTKEFQSLDYTKDFSYLLVNGETSKSSLKAYKSYREGLQEKVRSTPEQYKVGDLALLDYLAERGIKSSYINWKEVSIDPLLERSRENGQMYGISLSVNALGREKLGSDLDDMLASTNSIKVVATNSGESAEYQDSKAQDVILTSLADLDKTVANPFDAIIMDEGGRWYINSDPAGKALDKLNLYTLNPGDTETWTINVGNKTQDIQIKAVDKDVTSDNIMDRDFRTYVIENNERYLLAAHTDRPAEWVREAEVKADKNYQEVIFDSPEDIKKLYGGRLLRNRYNSFKNENQQTNVGTYQNSYQNYNNINDTDIKVKNYDTYSTGLAKAYQSPVKTKVYNNTRGTEEEIESFVPVEDLVSTIDLIGAENVDKDNNYPYIHKSIKTQFESLMSLYSLTHVGGFRGTTTHKDLKGASATSPHKYGFGSDVRKNTEGNEMFNALKNNEAMMRMFGIARILEENNHYHIEFLNSNI